MKKVVRWLVLLACALVSRTGGAVIHGEPEASTFTWTVLLLIDQKASNPDADQAEALTGICSATVLGKLPLTLLTAAHCLRDAKLEGPHGLPSVRVQARPTAPMAGLALTAAAYPNFAVIEKNLAEDLAILIFDKPGDETLGALPVEFGQPPESLYICGYGRSSTEVDTKSPHCASKRVGIAPTDFYRFVPRLYEVLDPLMHMQFRVQFDSKRTALSNPNALLAVSRLNSQGIYALEEPMPTVGDSGGPWIARQPGRMPGLVAITSFIETFYRRSPHWPFGKAAGAPRSDFPYVAYGVRLDTPEGRSRIEQARRLGGDISTPGTAPDTSGRTAAPSSAP